MKNFFSKIKEKAGYVSIETILLVGLLVAFAVAVLMKVKSKSKTIADKGSNALGSAATDYDTSIQIADGPTL